VSVSASLFGMALGVGLGVRHAFEPDHLAAVSVLAAERPGTRRGMLLGALWGVGHATSLLAWGACVALVAPGPPGRAADVFELFVAVMLVALGARAVRRAVVEDHRHAVPHGYAAVGARPLLVGIVHGLAGSGALTAFVMLELSGVRARFAFMALFGVGAAIGMSLMSGLAGWPLARVMRRPATARWVLATVGAASALLGIAWSWGPLTRLCG
jgi:hypothetical protein